MVLIIFGEEIQEIVDLPEKYEDFIEFIEKLFGIKEISKFYLKFSIVNKITKKLDIETYNEFFTDKGKDKTVTLYPPSNDKKTNELQNKEEKIEKDQINTDSIKVHENNEIKESEITKDMIIESIVKQVKFSMQRSRIMLEQKKEKEENRAVKEQINNLITDRLNNSVKNNNNENNKIINISLEKENQNIKLK